MSEQKTAAKPADEVIAQTPIADLSPSKQNLRTRVGDIKGLQRSIEDSGILEPLIARWTTDGEGDDDVPYLEVVAGHRRLEAAKRAGLETVPVVVRTITDAELSKAMLIENMQREELSPLEEATGYLRLVSDHEMTVKDLAKAVGRSQRHVSERLRLLDLPDEVATEMDRGEIPLSALQAFEALANHPMWDEVDEDVRTEAVAALRNNWRYPESVIDRVFRPIKRQQVIDTAKAKAEEKGIAWADPTYDYGSMKAGGKILGGAPDHVGSFYADEYIDLPTKPHRSEPCHAISVAEVMMANRDRKLKAVEVCTDQGRHTRKNATSELRPENYEKVQEARQREREERAREKAEREAREAKKGRMVQSLRKTDAYTLVGRLVIDEASETACKQAGKLLGIEEPTAEKPRWDGEMEPDWRETLRVLSEKSDADRSRVALALMLCSASLYSMHDDTKQAIETAMEPFAEADES